MENKITVIFRIIQAICLGVFSLGLSLVLSDYTSFIEVPISSIAITTTTFGLIGAVITEILARQSKRW